MGASMLTAGLTSGIETGLGVPSIKAGDSAGKVYRSIAAKSAIGAGVDGALRGKGLDEVARDSALRFGLASAQYNVGEAGQALGLKEGSSGKALMHGMLGAGYAEMTGGSAVTGFAAGAAVELMSPYLSSRSPSRDPGESILASASSRSAAALIGGLAAFAAGGSAEDIDTGSGIAGSAYEHNFLLHPLIRVAAIIAAKESAKAVAKAGAKAAAKEAGKSAIKETGKAGAKEGGKAAIKDAGKKAVESGGKKAKVTARPEKIKLEKIHWKIREGQEWKVKVIGKGQKTGTPGHAVRSYKEAIKAAKDDGTSRVYLNKGMNRVTGAGKSDRIKPNRRPDVTIVRKDGRIDQIEVPSKTDKRDILLERMKDTNSRLPEHVKGKTRIKEITTKKP